MYMHSTCTFTPVDAQSTLSCFTLKVLVTCWRVVIPCTCLRVVLVCHWVLNHTTGTPPYSKAVLLIFDSFTAACSAFKPCVSTYWPPTYKAGWQAYNPVDLFTNWLRVTIHIHTLQLNIRGSIILTGILLSLLSKMISTKADTTRGPVPS